MIGDGSYGGILGFLGIQSSWFLYEADKNSHQDFRFIRIFKNSEIQQIKNWVGLD
jgi:hypothetical protein